MLLKYIKIEIFERCYINLVFSGIMLFGVTEDIYIFLREVSFGL